MDQFQQYKIQNLVDSGYTQQNALNALNICDWDLSQARNFLKTQEFSGKSDEREYKKALGKYCLKINQIDFGY